MRLSRTFGQVPELYDEVRPRYPDSIFELIESSTGSLANKQVLDMAAGTGLASRALARRGSVVTSLDPDPALLAQLRRRTPDARAVLGIAESLPFKGKSFDLVTCATAWHWVDATVTATEVARVLRPGGRLALFWANHRVDRTQPWQAAQAEVYDRWKAVPGSWPEDSRRAVDAVESAAHLRGRGWDVEVEQEVEWSRDLTRERHVATLATHSVVIALGERSETFLAEVAAALEPWPKVTESMFGRVVVASPAGQT